MITFIIPTIGRETILRTINSLLNQSDPNWKAIVVCDGIPNISFGDSRISSIQIEKTGIKNHAGAVRNFGMKMAATEWIAFVDDDDSLSSDYINKFKEELFLNPDTDCVIFRMKDGIRGILPPEKSNNFIKNYVGISFAVKKSLAVEFEPSGAEDFFYLDKIRNLKKKMVISPYVTYFVRTSPNKKLEKLMLKRIIINKLK